MSDDPKAILGQLQAAFEEFKQANDEKLAAKADVVLDEKVERINADISTLQAALDEQALKIAAANVNGGERKIADPEYSAAFNMHIKKGEVQASLNKGADADGGFIAPREWDRTITDKLIEISPMRAISSVQSISGNGFTKIFNNRGTASGWVGETAARPETATPTFGSLAYVTGELYANPAATQQMLDDAEVDLESWLAGEVQTEFAYEENLAFVSGNGTNKPNGVLTYVTGGANAAAHPFGAVTSRTTTGTVGALTATDDLVNLVHDLPSAFTGNARFTMNRNTLSTIRKLKDGQGNYIWQPSFQAGMPSTLLGYSVTEVPAMPDVAASAVPILFGDFMRGYLVVDRVGTRVLRDPFTNKPYVHFYTTKRVGGGLLNPEVLKALTIRAV